SGPSTASRFAGRDRDAASAESLTSPLAGNRPRLHAARLELEGHDLAAELLERGGHPVAAVEAREEEEVTAAARARHLAAQGAGAARDRVQLVDVRRRDALGEALLLHPRLVQQVAEGIDVPEEQRALHLHGLQLQRVQRLDRALAAAPVALRLAVDDRGAL